MIESARIYVSFDVGGSDEEVEHTSAIFTDAGVPATVSSQPYSLTAAASEVADAFVVVATVSTTAFFTTLATKVASDTHNALKTLVRRLRNVRPRDQGRLEIIVRGDNGLDIVISPDTPDSALGELLTSPLPPAPSGTLIYDSAEKRWRDAGPR